MSVRAGIVVTGTEVLSGIIRDAQRPVAVGAAARARRRRSRTSIVVGDRPEDLRARAGLPRREGIDLIITSGGLGPTADDLTAEVVAEFGGREMVLDEALEERIWAIVERLRARWRGVDEEAMRAGTRKQALVPRRGGARAGRDRAGAASCRPTAPLVVGAARAAARAAADVGGRRVDDRAAAARCWRARARSSSGSCGFFGLPEPRSRATLRELDADVARRWRSRPACAAASSRSRRSSSPAAAAAYDAFEAALRERHGDVLFSDDGATIDEVVARLLGRAARSRPPSRAPAG